MIDVMIIDDDLAIREYLRDVVDWTGLDLRLICEAGDSETARELYLLYKPKIVITDINIPIISGLELAKEFSAADREVHIIVITGFGDFESVRASVNVGAIDLLEKPIVPDEINASLQRAAERLTQLRRQRHTEQALHELLDENRSLLQERCVAQLLAGVSKVGEKKIARQLKLLSLNFPHRYFAAVLFFLEQDLSGDLDGASFPAAFKKLCESSFTANGFCAFTYFGAANRLDCLVNWPFEQGDERLEAVLSKLLDETRFYFQKGFFVCIGRVVESLGELSQSAEQALMAGQFHDGSRIINTRNISQQLSSQDDTKLLELLIEHAQSFQYEEFNALLEEAFERMDRDALLETSLELLSKLSSMCFQAGAYPWSNLNYPETISRLFGSHTRDEMKDIQLSACRKLIATMDQQRTQTRNQQIQTAKEYIKANLGDPELSLDTVSEHVGLSKIYFCQLFHKEEGVSFINYLNSCRIERAKTLLRDTGKKIFEISSDLGYSNQKYFNYVFKHVVGVTPLEYRRENQEQQH